MMKETIAVLFGGQSSEHVVSCMSAANVIDQIDKDKYDLLLIGITEEGEWILTPSVEEIRNDTWRGGRTHAVGCCLFHLATMSLTRVMPSESGRRCM